MWSRVSELVRAGSAMMMVGAVVGAAIVAVESASAHQQTADRNSIELIVRGCLDGRELTADDISGNDELANEVGMIFRLSAKGELNNEIKRRARRIVVVTGVVKKTALARPGLRLGGGRVVIGGGPASQDPTRDPARNPTRRLIPMDISELDVIAESCPPEGP